MTVRRLALTILAPAALAAAGAAVWAARERAAVPAAEMEASAAPAAPMAMNDGMASRPAGTPRGPVTIDARRQQLMGIRVVTVERSALARTIRTVGTVAYDETRLTDVNLKIEGWIRDLQVDYTGQFVTKGDALFTLYSPDLLTTEQEYLLALSGREALAGATLEDAKRRADELVAAARERLRLWDLPDEAIARLETTRHAEDAVVFRAPASGFVVEKTAVQGQHVAPGQSLYRLADLSSVWIEADVYESELSTVRVGTRASVTLDAYPGETFDARVVYIYPYLDQQTRTNRVRLALPNPRGRLKPGMFANVGLSTGDRSGLTVPLDAVLDSGTEQVVFVAQGDGLFEPRRVRIGQRLGDAVEIVDGLSGGDEVATGATFFLDSESQLRASLQSYEVPALAGAAQPLPGTGVEIALRTNPDPPRTGTNQFEVTLADASGKPIDDANVAVRLFMPAMPTMNMPAMQNEMTLPSAGGGVYRGPGQVMMAGRWEATVTATRNGQPLGSRQQAVVAR